MKTISSKSTIVASFVAALLLIAPASAVGQEKGYGISDFHFETRLGYEAVLPGMDFNDDASGFRGSWLNMRLDGQICKGLTYSYRQRFNKLTERSFFDATDWIHLDWQAADWFSLSAGKQVVAIGGYEYDRAPIDLYYCSEFWNNIACYQIGVSGTFKASPGDNLLLQLCNSPMRGYIIDESGRNCGNSKIALNLMWYGSHGFYDTMWSVNAFQNTRDSWMYYIALGNRFNITDWLRLDLDLMDRLGKGSGFVGDFSIMSELSAAPADGLRIHAKFTWDRNRKCDGDWLVARGTNVRSISGGAEYSPVKKAREAVKLFAVAGYSYGDCPGVLGDRDLQIQAGVKFRLDILEGIKALIRHKSAE